MRQEGRRAGYSADAVLEHADYADPDAHDAGYPGRCTVWQYCTHDAGWYDRHDRYHRDDGHHAITLAGEAMVAVPDAAPPMKKPIHEIGFFFCCSTSRSPDRRRVDEVRW